jgi:hypothetical protein
VREHLEAAARTGGPIAAFPHRHANDCGDQLLNRVTRMRLRLDCRGERASVPAQQKAARTALDVDLTTE